MANLTCMINKYTSYLTSNITYIIINVFWIWADKCIKYKIYAINLICGPLDEDHNLFFKKYILIYVVRFGILFMNYSGDVLNISWRKLT